MAKTMSFNLMPNYTLIQYSCLSFITLIISFRIYCQCFVWRKTHNKRSLKGKTVVITGANSGIGKETAKQLVERGARVVMACRDQQSAEDTIEEISRCGYEGQMVYKHIDLCSFASVRQFAEDITCDEPSVHILINNAGVFGPPFDVTEDGFETQLQVNHLSSALLTESLVRKLHESSEPYHKSRVINVTSTLYRNGAINENDFKKGYANNGNYELRKAYSNSKLANILFSRRLHKEFVSHNQMIDVFTVSPGIVWTNLSRHLRLKWWQLILLSPFGAMFVRTPRQGSQTVLHCATADSLKADTLFRNCSEHKWDQIVSDSDIVNKVYEWTLNAINEKKLF